jgi:hypothetical protein
MLGGLATAGCECKKKSRCRNIPRGFSNRIIDPVPQKALAFALER